MQSRFKFTLFVCHAPLALKSTSVFPAICCRLYRRRRRTLVFWRPAKALLAEDGSDDSSSSGDDRKEHPHDFDKARHEEKSEVPPSVPDLKMMMNREVAEENYMKAAKYRDEIKKLEEEEEEEAKQNRKDVSGDKSKSEREDDKLKDVTSISQEDEKEILQVFDTFFTAFTQADLKLMEKVWLKASFVTCALPLAQSPKKMQSKNQNSAKEEEKNVGGALALGYDDVMRAWEQLWQRGSPTKAEVSGVAVQIVGGSGIAYATAEINIDAVRARILIAGRKVVTNVFMRRMGKWWVTHHHASPISPPERI